MHGSASKRLSDARSMLAHNQTSTALAYAREALNLARTPAVLRGAIRVFYDAGDIEAAASLVDELAAVSAANLGPGDRKLIQRVRARSEMLSWLSRPIRNPRFAPVERRVVNVLAYSLPYSSVGYATRSHGLAQGIHDAGWDIHLYTRLGFPLDQVPALAEKPPPDEDVIDGLTYRRLLTAMRSRLDELTYMRKAIVSYRRIFEERQPAVVHAASNYTTGLPALIAARECGLPFVYEVRGFWEITRASSQPAFAFTSAFRQMRLFESLVAKASDHVITLTSAMRDELIQRGVPRERISLVPNGVNTTCFSPRVRDFGLAEQLRLPPDTPVIGYIGSIVDYEGLDDLVDAARMIVSRNLQFHLLLVGDGQALPQIRKRVREAGLCSRTTFTGRVPHAEIPRFYSLVDICPFPRKAWAVCDMVSPLKPFEAMSAGKAVVASDARALADIVDHNRTGLLFRAGDSESLAAALTRLLVAPDYALKLGEEARSFVLSKRTWRALAEECIGAYVQARQNHGTSAAANWVDTLCGAAPKRQR